MSVKAEESGPLRPMASGAVVGHVRLIFILVVVAYFLDVIDASIVTVAAPSIKAEWAVADADLQWVYGAYALTIAGVLLLMGRAGDVYGQKKIFLAGLIIFTISSVTGGLAPFFLSLVVSRAIQGIGAAMTTVTAFAIFIGIYPEGRERNRAFGVLIAILSGGFAIGAVAVVLCQKFLPKTSSWTQTSHLDVPGAVTVTSGTMLFVYALTNAADPTKGFASELTLIPLVLSIVILGVFLLIESRSKSPLMPLSFIRRGSILTANTLGVVVTSVVGGISFIFTLYWQDILHYTAEKQGLAILPAAAIFFLVGGWGASLIMGKVGVRKTLLISTALVTLGVFLLTSITVEDNYYR